MQRAERNRTTGVCPDNRVCAGTVFDNLRILPGFWQDRMYFNGTPGDFAVWGVEQCAAALGDVCPGGIWLAAGCLMGFTGPLCAQVVIYNPAERLCARALV